MTDTRKTPRGAFAIVFSIVLMNSIGFGIIVPVMPALIMDVADVDLAEAALLGGVLSVSYAIMQVFFAPVLGNLADAYGRKRVLLVSVFTFGIDFLVMAMAPVFAWLVVGRLIAGLPRRPTVSRTPMSRTSARPRSARATTVSWGPRLAWALSLAR